MFGLKGGQESFGNLVGFPRTGTRMAWVVEGDKRLQRGFYRGPLDDGTTQGTPWTHPGTGYVRHTGPHQSSLKTPTITQPPYSWGNLWWL